MKISRPLLLALLLLLKVGFCGAAQSSSEYFDDAKKYFDKGEIKAAIIQLKNLLKDEPYDVKGRLLLGKSYLAVGDFSAAISEYEKARDLDAEPKDWVVHLSKAYLSIGQPRKVLENIKVDPSLSTEIQANVIANTGMAYLMLRESEKAEAQFSKALEIDAKSSEAQLGKARMELQAGNSDVSSQLATQVIDRDPENIDAWLILGENGRVSGNYESALESFDKAIFLNAKSVRGYLGRATINIVTRELESAERDVEQVKKIAGEIPMALYLQGAILFERKSYPEAKESLLKLISMVPEHLPSQLILGTIAYFQNELESANSYLSRYVKESPGHLSASKLLAATALKLNQTDEAVSVLLAVEEKGRNDAQFLALLGTAYMQSKQFDKGTQALERAAEIAPDVAAIRAQLAIGLLASGETDKAVGELSSAVDLGQDLIQADIMLILALIQQKNYDLAIEKGRVLAEKMPENPVADNLIGAAYLAKGETELARKSWMHALTLQPDYSTALMNLAKLEIKLEDNSAAEEWFNKILQQDAENLPAMLGMAQLAKIKNDKDETLKWLLAAYKSNPEKLQPSLLLANFYVSNGNVGNAMTILEPLKNKFPENPVLLRGLGLIQLTLKDTGSAIDTFYELISIEESNPEYHHLLAQAYAKSKELDKARQQWKRCLELKADYLPAEASLARLAIRKKDYKQARILVDGVKLRHSDSSIGHQLEGEIEFQLEHYKKANNAFKKGFEIKPSSALVQNIFRTHKQSGEIDQAFAALEQWLKDNPDDLGSVILLGMAYQEKGDANKALDVYEAARKINPENVVVLNNLAWLYQESNDDRAVETAEAALSLAKNNPEVVDTVGWVLMQNGQAERSLVLFQEAVLKAPDILAIRIHLAEAFIKVGRVGEARKELENLLNDNPEFPERTQAQQLLSAL